MFCPRCGHTVSDTANFCGGCGLPRAEIEKMSYKQANTPQPENVAQPIDMEDINTTISQLEGDLTGLDVVEDYTINQPVNTDKVENDFVNSEIRLELQQENLTKTENKGQSEYSYNAPKHPYYSQKSPVENVAYTEENDNLSTVDFIWMLLISSIPVIGLVYLLYHAISQSTNPNKRSWARATLIIYIFAIVLGMVFSLGIMMTSFMFW